ncbi:MAG: RagB/SusD family nutrient uptake outer membrane protein, partial [Deltaproteobacteria bacterium]|nr:RagB/SusD family nutrient uptake outer membrane protein [Deltaproteobacteria bacterium]
DYNAALLDLYSRVRDDFNQSAGQNNFPCVGTQSTDLAYNHKNIGQFKPMSETLLPTNSIVYVALWEPAYRIIYGVNAIVERAASGDNELTPEEVSSVVAEARFFRGYMYKMLANLYGGVPLIIEEVKEPKRDFIRASRVETYDQAASDLEFAAANLKDIDDVASERVNNLAAYHLLAEVYISLERWQDAINAASTVIDHPSTGLMMERFGTLAGELFLIPQYETNVYWDLFRQGNLNRSDGNREAIWVLQYEWALPGGGEDGGGGPLLERAFSPRAWQAKVENLDGSTSPLVPKANAYTAGRSSGFVAPSYWFKQTLWEASGFDQDMRNADCNIVRDFLVRNPSSDHNGLWIFKDNLPIR